MLHGLMINIDGKRRNEGLFKTATEPTILTAHLGVVTITRHAKKTDAINSKQSVSQYFTVHVATLH